MLVLGLFEMIFLFLSFLLQDLTIMSLPESIGEFFTLSFTYLEDGLGILNVYFDLSYLFMLLGCVLVVDIFLRGWAIILWILRKIPLLNIS